MAVSFRSDIKGLFRDKDVRSMIKRFDLSNYDDVVSWADRILQQLESGKMPCDGAWTESQLALFRQWIEDGKLP